MSIKDVFEVIAIFLNLIVGGAFMLMTFGLIVISAFPDAIQPKGYYRNKIRTVLQLLASRTVEQLKFLLDVFGTLTDRQRLKETLEEIETGQKSLQLR